MLPHFSRTLLPFAAGACLVSGAALTTTPKPAWAADTIVVVDGGLQLPIAVADLETFVQTNQLPPKLQFLASQLLPGGTDNLQQILKTTLPVPKGQLARLLNTPTTYILLQRVGQVIQTGDGQNGAPAIQAALTKAIATPQGLNLLNFLRQFPSPTIQVNIRQGLTIGQQVTEIITTSIRALNLVAQVASQEVATSPPVANLPPLTGGTIPWQKSSLSVTDTSRQRTFSTDMYLPTTPPPTPPPLVVISYGLGEDLTSFAYLAQFLASQGFAVAIPENPESNADYFSKVLAGAAPDPINPQALVNRPLDIRALLDDLGRRVTSDPALRGRLNPQQVAAIGHSLGGYTVLALAGAPISQGPEVRQVCDPVLQGDILNISFLLQCRVLALTNPPTNFRDPRIKAVLATNPVGSVVFGPAGFGQIQVPTLLLGSTEDFAAPVLSEQIRPFTWLNTPSRYLTILENGTHFSVMGGSGSGVINLPPAALGPDRRIGQEYLRVLSLAFVQTHVNNQPKFQPYLSAAYAQVLSKPAMPLRLIQNLTPDQLNQALTTPVTATTQP